VILLISFVSLGFLLLSIQTTVFSFFPDWLGKPDFIFILIVFVAYRFNWISGIFLAFCFGWMLDVVSGIYLGTYLCMALLVFCLVKFFTQNSPVKETAYQVPLVGLSYFCVQCIFYVFFLFIQPGVLPPWSWVRVAQETFILLVAAIPCFVLFNWLYEKITRHRLASKVKKRMPANRFR